jgi:hypothetical protein
VYCRVRHCCFIDAADPAEVHAALAQVLSRQAVRA